MAVKHNAVHQFAAGLNSKTALPNVLPFTHFTQQGWKMVYEGFDEKLGYAADSAIYEFTAIGSGTATVSAGGILLANSTTTDNEGAIINAITPTIIPVGSTKKFYLEVSATLTAAGMSDTEFFAGVSADQGTTIGDFVAAGGDSWAVDDAFGVAKLDGGTTMTFIARQNDVEQSISFGSNPTTATRHVWGVYYSGTTYYLYKDGVLVASEVKSVFNDDAAMGVVAFFRSGTSAAQSAKVNYIQFAYEL